MNNSDTVNITRKPLEDMHLNFLEDILEIYSDCIFSVEVYADYFTVMFK